MVGNMAKIFTYSMILVGIMVLANVMGLPTFTGQLLDGIGYYANNPLGGSFWQSILGIFILFAAVGTITVGIYTNKVSESFLVTSLCILIATASIGDMFSLMSYVSGICSADCSWMIGAFKVVFFILIIGYLISIVQWWRGNDI